MISNNFLRYYFSRSVVRSDYLYKNYKAPYIPYRFWDFVEEERKSMPLNICWNHSDKEMLALIENQKNRRNI